MNFLKKHHAVLWGIVIFLSIALACQIYLYISQKPEQQPRRQFPHSGERIIQQKTNTNYQKNNTAVPSSTPASNETTNLITAKLLVNTEEYSTLTPPSSTLYDFMKLLAADSKKPFLAEYKNYPGMGMFVESINGVKNDNQTQTYWIYYINGAVAKIGISQYIVQPNDIITWKFEKSKF